MKRIPLLLIGSILAALLSACVLPSGDVVTIDSWLATPSENSTDPNADIATAEAYNVQGTTLYTEGQFEEAIYYYDLAIELNPEIPIAYFNRGLAYADLGKLEKAIADYDQAIELFPNFADAHSRRGTVYAWLGDFEHSFTDHDRAIELDPDNAEAYRRRGMAHASFGNIQQAIEDYNRAIELNPNDAEIHFNLGNVFDAIGQYEQAITSFDAAIRLSPNPRYYLNRGYSFHGFGNLVEAVADYDVAISNEPTFALAYANRGLAHAGMRSYYLAAADLETFLKLASDWPEQDLQGMREQLEQFKTFQVKDFTELRSRDVDVSLSGRGFDWLVTVDAIAEFSEDLGIFQWEVQDEILQESIACRIFGGHSWSVNPNFSANCIIAIPGAPSEHSAETWYAWSILPDTAIKLESSLAYAGKFELYGSTAINGDSVYDGLLMNDNLLYWVSISVGTGAGHTAESMFDSMGREIEAYLDQVLTFNVAAHE